MYYSVRQEMTMRRQRSVRLLEEVDEGIGRIAERTGRDFSAVVNELLDEALKMRRIPGIVFVDSPSGRVAKIAGTGIGVWEIIMGCRDVDEDWCRLREGYHWLTETQLRTALAYAEAYPEEIERRIEIDEQWTPERVWEMYPFMRPADQR
jgi:uncharacterized protein (DUF433 family)